MDLGRVFSLRNGALNEKKLTYKLGLRRGSLRVLLRMQRSVWHKKELTKIAHGTDLLCGITKNGEAMGKMRIQKRRT